MGDIYFSDKWAEVFVLLDDDIFDVKDVRVLGGSSPFESVAYFIEKEIVIEYHWVDWQLGGWICVI